jgi:hypothetical protein
MGKKIEGYFSTGQSPQWALVPVAEEELVRILKFQLKHKMFKT